MTHVPEAPPADASPPAQPEATYPPAAHQPPAPAPLASPWTDLTYAWHQPQPGPPLPQNAVSLPTQLENAAFSGNNAAVLEEDVIPAAQQPGLLTAPSQGRPPCSPVCGDPCGVPGDALHDGVPYGTAASSPSLWNLDLLHSPLAVGGCLGSPLSLLAADGGSWLWPPLTQGVPSPSPLSSDPVDLLSADAVVPSNAGGDAPVQGPAHFAGGTFAGPNLDAAPCQVPDPTRDFPSNASAVHGAQFHAALGLPTPGTHVQSASDERHASQVPLSLSDVHASGACHPRATPLASLPSAFPHSGPLGTGTATAQDVLGLPAGRQTVSGAALEDSGPHGGQVPHEAAATSSGFDWENDEGNSDALHDILQELGLAVGGTSEPCDVSGASEACHIGGASEACQAFHGDVPLFTAPDVPTHHGPFPDGTTPAQGLVRAQASPACGSPWQSNAPSAARQAARPLQGLAMQPCNGGNCVGPGYGAGTAVAEHGGAGVGGAEGKAAADDAICKGKGTRQRRGKQRGPARKGKENVAPAPLKASTRRLKAGRPPIADPVKSKQHLGDCAQPCSFAGAVLRGHPRSVSLGFHLVSSGYEGGPGVRGVAGAVLHWSGVVYRKLSCIKSKSPCVSFRV